MQEIVTKVLEAEQEAEQLLSDARKKAAELRAAADAEAAGRLQEARLAAQTLIQETLARTRAEAEAERARTVRQAELEAERFLQENQEALERVEGEVVALVITPEYGKG